MKRFIFAIAALSLLFFLVACSRSTTVVDTTEIPGTTPTSSTSRNVGNNSVKVTETYANTDVVAGTATVAPQSTEAAASTPAPADTPATGDFPITYFAGVIGLILVCSAGLIMLKRI